MKTAIAKMFGILIRLAWRVAFYGASDPVAEMRLGQFYGLLQRSSHEMEVKRYRAKYRIDATVRLGLDTVFTGEGSVSIGEGSYIGRNSFVAAHPREARIVVGKGCAISHSVHIRTAGYSTETHLKEALVGAPTWSDVTIGDYVWIGAHAVITGGVTIGSNSVIGANAVVTHDVPANAIYGGVPARQIRLKPDNGDDSAAKPYFGGVEDEVIVSG